MEFFINIVGLTSFENSHFRCLTKNFLKNTYFQLRNILFLYLATCEAAGERKLFEAIFETRLSKQFSDTFVFYNLIITFLPSVSSI